MVTIGEYNITSMKQETPDTVSFVLSGKSIEHDAGQFVMLEYPGENAGAKDPEKPVKRAYSIASGPKRGRWGEIELCVKEMPGGWISKLLQNVTLSTSFQLSGPFGRFIFNPKEHKDIVMLAAGSGIAPFAAFLEQIRDGKLETKACLIFSNKTEADIIYRRWLNDLVHHCKNSEVHYTLTRRTHEEIEGEKIWLGKSGRIDKTMLSHICGEDLSGKDVFICGPLVFVKSMRAMLEELGVSQDKVHFESYG
jgi:ferredoxin-NADP reductase